MKLWTWIRTWELGGEYPAPSSEAQYNAHSGIIDAVLPVNGGKLKADGSWLQESAKCNTEFAQNLAPAALAMGQLYLPILSCERSEIQAFLDTEALWEHSADTLLELALESRFDAPWDGVMLDLEGIPSSYKDKLGDYLLYLSYRIREEGLTCGISVRGKASDPGPDYDDAYSYDFRVVGQAADVIGLRVYGYWKPINSIPDRSLSPYWWIVECVAYALEAGIPAERTHLGIGTFSKYYPDSGSNSGRVDITYDSAAQLAAAHQASMDWIERGAFGLVRERLANWAEGHVWIHDGDVIRHQFDLVERFGLAGVNLFLPGMGDEYHWQVIAEFLQ